MRNRHVARLFATLADLIEFRGLDETEAKGYRTAAYHLRGMTEDVDGLLRTGRLPQVPELGPHLARKVREVLETGRLRRLEDLLEPVGADVLELLSLPGLKVSLLARLHRDLDIRNVKDLEAAHRRGRHGELGRELSDAEWERVVRALGRRGGAGSRKSLGEIRPAVEELLGILRGATGRRELAAVGAYAMGRLWHDAVAIHCAVAREHVAVFREIFRSLPGLEDGEDVGPWGARGRIEGGIPVLLRCVPPAFRGVLSVMATASPAHVEGLRRRARLRDMRLAREYLYRGKRRVETPDEAAFYALLDLPWIPPELREGGDEILRAEAGELPALLVRAAVRGDLHVHSDWSDGGSSLEALAIGARRRGLAWLAVCDHSRGLAEAKGLPVARLRQRNVRIDEINARGEGAFLLKGAEVEIRPDGSLDYSDEVLDELDVVVAAVHHGRRGRGWMTDRMVRALRTGKVHVLAHPNGSLVGERPPYPVDMDEVVHVASREGVALEINGHRKRMDLSPQQAKRVLDAGGMLSLGSDAHQVEDLSMLDLAVIIARRGEAGSPSVLNAMDLDSLRAWLRRPRSSRSS